MIAPMPAASTSSDALVRLVSTLDSSLATYLVDSGLQTYPGAASIRDAVGDLVAEQRGVVGRAVTILDEREVALPRPFYPMSYTALHDVDLRHLLARVVADQRGRADACAAVETGPDRGDAAAVELATEAAALTRRHLERLEGLIREPAAPAASA
jgi:hypothetical protein